MRRLLLSGLLAGLSTAPAFAQQSATTTTTVPCSIQMGGAGGYRCLNLLKPIDSIQILKDSTTFRYRSQTAGTSPTDYQFNPPSPASCDDNGNDLYFSVTYPSNYDYATCGALPCIALFHAGGFVESGADSDNDALDDYVSGFAKRGYVVFNVQYRTGWNLLEAQGGIGDTNNTASQIMAAYRAAQDTRGFLRSLRKMQADGLFNGHGYKFDLAKLYLGGCSAGGFNCINAAYISQTEIEASAPGLVPILGALNKPLTGAYYYGSDSTYALPTISGVVSFWGAGGGALGAAVDSANFLDANSPVFIGFSGRKDRTAPAISLAEYRYQPSSNPDVHQCSNSIVYPASTYNSNGAAADFRLYGNLSIYNRLRQLGRPAEVYLDSNMGHGLKIKVRVNNQNRRIYDTAANFGLSNPTEEKVIDYMVGRAATFFQAARNGTYGTLVKTKFEDAVNCRYGRQTDYNCVGPEPSNSCTGSSRLAGGDDEGAAPAPLAGGPGWTLSPVPAQQQCTIRSTNGEALETVAVYDSYGRLVWQARPAGPVLVLQRCMLGQASGLYLVEVQVGGQRTRQRLLWLN